MPFGKLHQFDISGASSWPNYVRLVKQFILLNEIKAELHVATLVTHVGAATYELMCDLCSPRNPEAHTFDELVNLVTKYFEPKRSEIAERHVFRQRRQGESETISEFLKNLKHLATYCNFGNSLEENIRDQFVSGIRSDDMRSRLFAESSLDYKRAVELAFALEAAERHATEAAAGGAAQRANGSGDSGGTAAPAAGLHRVGERSSYRSAGARRTCTCCGKGSHVLNKCRYKKYKCKKCDEVGHLAVMCKKSTKYQNYMQSDSECDESDGLFHMLSINTAKDGPYYCKLKINDCFLSFEVDTGSKISAISQSLYNKHFSYLHINNNNLKLHSYTGEAITPLGYIMVRVMCGSEIAELPLFIIDKGGPPLLGRHWLRELKLNSINLNHLSIINEFEKDYKDLFSPGNGTFKNKIKLFLKDKTPIYCKARPLPLALREPVERELERLQKENVIYKVDRSDYGTPIVPIIKRDGTIRLCGDYKITINKVLKDFHYPLPRIEQLFAALSGGEQYSKIDLKNAYLQVVLDEATQPITAITTHVGTFVYRRAPFGIKCLPEIFQKLIEDTLSGIDCVVFIDDICVTGKTVTEHTKNLRAVLDRLKEAGLKIKFEKCEFYKDEVCYLGFKINKHGIHTDASKIEAISKAPVPQNVTQLRAALGLINYYARFIPNISTILYPLYALLKKNAHWTWSNSCDLAFSTIKKKLVNSQALAHYEPDLPLVLSVDSSAYGLGAILAQVYSDGSERIVACASRSLSDAERRYSQIDKEALAIVYGVTRHHQYVFGRHFTLRSDHKALSYIFGPKHGIPQTAASRLQRYAVRLAAYNYNIVFVPTNKNSNADALSRLPLVNDSGRFEDAGAAFVHFVEESFPLSHIDVARETKKDVLLSKVYGYIMSGWPDNVEIEKEKPYFYRKENLHVDHGCIVWGYRIVIPVSLRKQIVEEVHQGHVGVVRMKQIARNYVWWPALDAELEDRARNCDACRAERDAPSRAQPVPYSWPKEPWSRLHADFLQYDGKYYFLLIDSHSKWIEVSAMSSGTSAGLVANKLREIFARFGLPKQMVTDGGPPFTSNEFEMFLKRNGIKHILTAPYHPASNGAAENAVKTVKKVLKKAAREGENIERALNKFLFQYRNSAHCTTQREPAVAIFGRRLRTRLDKLRASTAEVVSEAQQRQIECAGGATAAVNEGDAVLVRSYDKTGKWSEGVVTRRTGAVTYEVKTDNKTQRRHIDQIIPDRKLRFSISNNNNANNEEDKLGNPPPPTSPQSDEDTEPNFSTPQSKSPQTLTTPNNKNRDQDSCNIKNRPNRANRNIVNYRE